MSELVRAEAVETLVRGGLAPGLRDQPRWVELATRLAHEAAVYGVGVLDDRLFARPSGVELAAAICEDVEAVARLAPLFAPREVERMVEPATEASDAEEGTGPPQPQRVVETVWPRVGVESRGRGLTAVALAVAQPEIEVEALEPELRRRWLLARAVALFGCPHLRVRAGGSADHRRDGYDCILLKGLGPVEALDHALPLLKPDGRLLVFLSAAEVAALRRHRTDEAGRPIRLEKTLLLESAPAHGRVVACVGCVKADHEAHAAA